jgi:hypothetical protein
MSWFILRGTALGRTAHMPAAPAVHRAMAD